MNASSISKTIGTHGVVKTAGWVALTLAAYPVYLAYKVIDRNTADQIAKEANRLWR